MRADNVAIFNETLDAARQGRYAVDGRTVTLSLSPDEMRAVIPLSPESVKTIIEERGDKSEFLAADRMDISVSNRDSFLAAMDMAIGGPSLPDGKSRVLVLNFANPVHPGGGVIRGATAQEEDLCRKSTLYLSLKSNAAKKMYQFNQKREDYLASDYMLLSPNVEIMRGSDGQFLTETVVVSVLTAAAPMISRGRLTVSMDVLNDILRRRIRGILHVAVHFGYTDLVLGAWGCGAFGNDAQNMARLFYEEIKGFSVAAMDGNLKYAAKDFFNKIEFAVLDRTKDLYNYKSFEKYFQHCGWH